ncbi:DedA family protein [Tardiphaga sp.]|jgi:membrane protein DedA with SNARE-associated domain|uniref:DedA family protein n=1 Tax=Tardiphaga sp. TaxID=1926292 RepID=UPI0037D9A187
MVATVTSIIERSGVIGIFLLMFLENVFPPIPSEVIMPLAGFVASRGSLNIVSVIVAGTCGTLLGAFFWYGVGRWLGQERLRQFAVRHGRWLTLTADDVDRTNRWFNRWGVLTLIFGRIIPGVRTLISVPAGVFHVHPGKFIALSTIGSLAWSATLALAGYALGENYSAASGLVERVGTAVLLAVIAVYLYRVVTFDRK